MISGVEIPGYRLFSGIHESLHSLAFRARREPDDLPVVIKIPRADYPPIEELARYKQEYQVGAVLKGITGAVHILDLTHVRNKPAIVMEDFGAESLKKLMAAQVFSLTEKIGIAIKIVQSLGEIHAARVIHKDINPGNILVNLRTGQLKLIDFGNASLLPQETATREGRSAWIRNPAYISPEQTGSSGVMLDYRTDFYALGATLYELFCRKLPFDSEDPEELLRCHLSRQPAPPHRVAKDVPEVLSEIVLKLMAKHPDRRYQSARGLKADLDECLDQLRRLGEISTFAVGRSDFPEGLRIPDKLYGREQELGQLLSALERATRGQSELLLISGYSGIGKTTLVKQLLFPLSQKRGYFLSGKFDQLQRSRPYTAFVDAFKLLVKQLLSEPEERLSALKIELDRALGRNGTLLLDLAPELELILGPADGREDLPPAERQSLFNLALQAFIGVLANPEHPVVLFLDDLQWADLASLRLLQSLLGTSDTRSLLVIGAYRDNEVGPAHPLLLTVEELSQAGCRLSRLSLAPLGLGDVSLLLAETLRCDSENTQPLAELLSAKTEGNPFFLKEYLQSLAGDGLLSIDPDTGEWDWEMDRIRQRRIADNVAEFMVGRIQRLPAAIQSVLQLAACVGNQFDLETLSVIDERPPAETLGALTEAAVSGLVVPLSNAYKTIGPGELAAEQAAMIEFRFAHDRIQQAAYALIPSADKPGLHRRIGSLLLAHFSPQENDPKLFDIVNHLDFARSQLLVPSEREELARLNLLAGKRAKSSGAYHQALLYLQTGRELLGPEGWTRERALTLSTLEEAAEAAYLCTDYAQMEQLTDEILARARTVLEQVKAYQVRIDGCVAQFNLTGAISTALTVLRIMGVRFPKKPSRARAVLDFLKTRLVLLGKRTEALLDLPEMKDPERSAELDIMRSISYALYLHAPNLYAMFIFRQFRLLLRHGHNRWSGSVFVSFGGILCGVIGDFATGYRLGKLAQQLNERFSATQQKCRTIYLYNFLARHWKEHLRDCLPGLQEAYQIGQETGDFNFSALAGLTHSQYGLYAGKPLAEVESDMAAYTKAIARMKQESQLSFSETFHQCVLNLMGRARDPVKLVGEAFDEERSLPILEEAKDRTGICAMYFSKTLLCCFFQRAQPGAQLADLAAEYSDASRGQFGWARLVFYTCLAWLGFYKLALPGERRRLLKKAEASLAQLRRWAALAPMNHQHAYCLAEAERCRVLGKTERATELYELAIRFARENAYLHEEALALELAGRFHLPRGRFPQGRDLLRDAHYAYLTWGAKAKVADLEAEFPDLFLVDKT